MKVSINALDSMDSPLWTNANGVTHNLSYSPFGNTFERSGDDSLLPGFNGERLDPVGQSYNLGNGYRTYNPTLMRFNAPDSWSPFGSGGLNQYAYCEGDPINRSDPSGHMSWQAGVGIGLGILGALGAIFTFGQSIAAAAAAEAALTASMAADLIATGLGVAASVTGIASTATQESDPEASRVLGWVSFGLGIASFATHTGNSIESKIKGRSGSCDLSHDGGKGDTKSTHITWGGKMKNMTVLDNGVFSFEDVYHGEPRLTISMHGDLLESGAAMACVGENAVGGHLSPYELIERLSDKSINISNYKVVNLHMCYGANGGENSFAQRLATIANVKVKAYHGTVTSCTFEPNETTALFKEAAQNGLENDLANIYAKKHVFITTKVNPYSIFSSPSKYFSFNYAPRYFNP